MGGGVGVGGLIEKRTLAQHLNCLSKQGVDGYLEAKICSGVPNPYTNVVGVLL